MKKILVIGKTGQVASCLREQVTPWATIEHLGRPELDLLNSSAVAQTIANHAPDIVINAAAYTAVDKAEAEPKIAHAINAIAPEEIAKGAAAVGAPIIHLSTDYVFDGTEATPYKETDATAPLGVYGRTKLEGEQRVAAANSAHIIVRTAWVYSSHGTNFVKSMLRLAEEHKKLTIVSDQIGCPTSAHDLANTLLELGKQFCTAPRSDNAGIVNISGTGIASWYDFAKAVFRCSHDKQPKVVPISTEDFPTPAKRPANSRLDTSRLEQHFGMVMPEWNDSLRIVVSKLNKSA